MELIDEIGKKTKGRIREVLMMWAGVLGAGSDMGVSRTASAGESAAVASASATTASAASSTSSTFQVDEEACQEATALYYEVDESRREKRLLKLLLDAVKDRSRFESILEGYSKLFSRREGGRGRLSGRGTILEEIVDLVVEMTTEGEAVYFAKRLHKFMEVR